MKHLRPLLVLLALYLALLGGAWLVQGRLSALATRPAPPPVHRPRPPGPGFDPRPLMAAQPALLARAADAMQAQRKGQVDLFAIGFAGDGTERVFRNEVEYFSKLMATRFDSEGHTLSLVNSPGRNEQVPLATLDNLREALRRVGARMDPEEDVLVLFLTSHGSREHELVVDQPPLKLDWIRPGELRRALDEAGIRWRVVIVSSCYSGGFVPDLRDPRTLVITAARTDRTSFGCGKESKITYFGDAYLAHALNETTDFEGAFYRARGLVRDWERRDRATPSEPQVSVGRQIGAKLAAWRAGAKAGPPLPFAPR